MFEDDPAMRALQLARTTFRDAVNLRDIARIAQIPSEPRLESLFQKIEEIESDIQDLVIYLKTGERQRDREHLPHGQVLDIQVFDNTEDEIQMLQGSVLEAKLAACTLMVLLKIRTTEAEN